MAKFWDIGKPVYHTTKFVAVFIIVTSALLPVNIALLLNTVTLLFSRRLFHRFGTRIVNLWCCFCVFCLEKYLNFSFTCRAPDLSQIERAILIVNHQSFLDVPVIHCCAHEFGKGQHPRWLGKKSFKYTPLLGWSAHLSGTIMSLHRDWARDREGIQTNLQALVATARPFWLCFFPEGTRITPAKRETSQRYARTKNYPLLHKVLLPRPKGFTAAVQGLREHIDAVLDVSIYYSQRPPFISSIMRGKRIDIIVWSEIITPDTLPRDDAGLKQHLLDIYRSKDTQLLELEKKT